MSKKPFKCKQCGKEFKQNNDLRRHERAHKGTKTLKCDECGKNSYRLEILNDTDKKKKHKNSTERLCFAVNSLMTLTTEDISATANYETNIFW
ncbi:zinc finger, C2H2 type [Onchocerca flexuosa]|uniref:Zinc finger, C2H2 type n=1 Tax=Onchocerca flexuosa TaxID=387005 RepID=A0A238BP46_9BILA|nr:zinc finger, C2H2 type [Onchocerca flexuosa]